MLISLLSSVVLAGSPSSVPTSLPSSAGQFIHCDAPESLAALHAPRRYTEIAQQLRPATPLTLVLGKYGRSIEWSRTTPKATVLAELVGARGYSVVDGALVPAEDARGVLRLSKDGELVAGELHATSPVDALQRIDLSKPGCWVWDRRSTALTHVDVQARTVESSVPIAVLTDAKAEGLHQQMQAQAAKRMVVPGVVPRSASVPRSVGVPLRVVRFNVPDPPFFPAMWGGIWAPGAVQATFPGVQVWWAPSERPAATLMVAAKVCKKDKMCSESKINDRMWTRERIGRKQYLVQLDDAVALTDNDQMAEELLKGVGETWWSEADRMQEPGVITLTRADQGVERASMQTVEGVIWARLSGHAGSRLAVPGMEFGGYDTPGMSLLPVRYERGVLGGASGR